MYSTIYIVLSQLYHWLDVYPSYRHFREMPGYEKVAAAHLRPRWRAKVERAVYALSWANCALCLTLIALKIAGLLPWW